MIVTIRTYVLLIGWTDCSLGSQLQRTQRHCSQFDHCWSYCWPAKDGGLISCSCIVRMSVWYVWCCSILWYRIIIFSTIITWIFWTWVVGLIARPCGEKNHYAVVCSGFSSAHTFVLLTLYRMVPLLSWQLLEKAISVLWNYWFLWGLKSTVRTMWVISCLYVCTFSNQLLCLGCACASEVTVVCVCTCLCVCV